MTLLIASEAIDSGFIKESEFVPVDISWNQRGNGLPITRVLTGWRKPVPLRDLMMATATESKNDAAVSLAIAVAKAQGWGNTEGQFVSKMNERAKELGLQFVASNASGLPEFDRDVLEDPQIAALRTSTMADISKLMRIVEMQHPRVATMLGTREIKLQGQTYMHVLKNIFNFNLSGFPGKVEALKSGMTCASGYAASIVYGNMVLGYVGAHSHSYREKRIQELLKRAQVQQELSHKIPSEQTPR